MVAKAEEYRRMAEQCERVARVISDRRSRLEQLALAKHYRQLADEIERRIPPLHAPER